jgi:hypothetical protein
VRVCSLCAAHNVFFRIFLLIFESGRRKYYGIKGSSIQTFTTSVHRSHFGSRYHIWLMRLAGLFVLGSSPVGGTFYVYT